MKSLALVVLVLISHLAAQAQGTVQFKNFDEATGWNAPVLVYDFSSNLGPRLTPVSEGYVVELLTGPSPLSLKPTASTNFLSGAQDGYFDGGVQSIPGVPSGSNAFVQIRVWATWAGSFAAAQAASIAGTWGINSVFSLATGTSNAPAELLPFQTFVLNPPLTVYPCVYAIINRGNRTIDVTFADVLQISSDLVKWTDVANLPDVFTTYYFPVDRAAQFFRARYQ